uniref:Peptide chain release factor 1 (RF-1) n=1 Tax=mine drainage metagenome TaxID=410659 RepID=E6PC46_9ZZZZ
MAELNHAMIERLRSAARRFDEIERELGNPSGAFDQARFAALSKERATLEPTVAAFRQRERIENELRDAESLARSAGEPELRALADEEIDSLRGQLGELEMTLQELMLPRDPDDDRDVFIEIRGGAGGDEAAIFAGDLARMYMRYAESHRMKVELLSESPSEAGGYKEIVFSIKGAGAYRRFKYESGVHRVQRVPQTESQGRVHTSTATVAVLPQIDDDVTVEIRPSDLQIDTYKSSGAGGQYVNKTESAIRITHVPTGVVVASQQERSQIQNREKAMQMLRSTLYERKRREQEEELGSIRRSQVGTGDRSEKIRTYNYPQDRITDHRVNENFGNLRSVLDGDMDRLVDALLQDERARLLAGSDTSVPNSQER